MNSKGLCGITSRITYLKHRKQFSTGLFINPNFWNSKQQLVKPPEPDVDYINSQLSLIRTKLSQAFLFLKVKVTDFNAQDIYLQYKEETNKKDFGVVEVYNLHSDRIKKSIWIDSSLFFYSFKIKISVIHSKSVIKSMVMNIKISKMLIAILMFII